MKRTLSFRLKECKCGEPGRKQPEKKLKAFKKTELEPGEMRRLTFTLGYRDFAYYDPEAGDWLVEAGTFVIHAASSARDIRQSTLVEVVEVRKKFRKLSLDSQHTAVFENPRAKELYLQFLADAGVIAGDRIWIQPTISG